MTPFHLSIAREALAAALSRAALAASTRSHLPVMGCAKLECADGALRLTTTNYEHTLTLAVAADIRECKPICLPVKRLLDIVNALPPGAVTIRGNESSTKAVVSGGRTKLELYGFPASEFPVPEKRQFDGKFGLDAAAFAGVFSQIGIHCSTAPSRQQFGGILLDSRDDGLFLVAMDGSAVGARVKFAPAIEPRGQWIFPRAAAAAITKLFSGVEEPLRIAVSDVAVRLSTEGVRLDLRLVDGKYAGYLHVFGRQEAKNIGAVDAAALKAVIQRVSSIGDVKLTVLAWYSDRVEVRAQSDNGIVNDEVPCRYSGEAGFTLGLTVEHVANAIATIAADDLRFYMTAPNRNMVITDAATDAIDREVAIAPLRIIAEPAQIAA